MADKRFPTDTSLKSALHVNDSVLISDSEAAHQAKRTTIDYLIDKVNSELSPATASDTAFLSGAIDQNTSDITSNDSDILSLQNDTTFLSGAIDANIANVVEDTAPQLGGDLDGQGYVVSDIELQSYSETVVSASSSGNILTLDYELGNIFETTLTENLSAVNFTNPPVAAKAGNVTLKITQDPVTPRTVDWGDIKWDGGSAPTVTASVSAVDFYTFSTFDGGTTWYGFTAGQDMS